MQIVITNSKGGCGKSTLVASISEVIDADIIDHDNQGTIRVASEYTGRHTPTTFKEITRSIILHDTPPYNSTQTKSLLREADLILIPTKARYPDLLAIKTTTEIIKSLRLIEKTVIIFNEVRKPHSKTYKELKELYKSNYNEFKFAKTELSNLVSFARVLAEPLKGKALEEIKQLAIELNIYKKYTK